MYISRHIEYKAIENAEMAQVTCKYSNMPTWVLTAPALASRDAGNSQRVVPQSEVRLWPDITDLNLQQQWCSVTSPLLYLLAVS